MERRICRSQPKDALAKRENAIRELDVNVMSDNAVDRDRSFGTLLQMVVEDGGRLLRSAAAPDSDGDAFE
jgi:hypothetical protein